MTIGAAQSVTAMTCLPSPSRLPQKHCQLLGSVRVQCVTCSTVTTAKDATTHSCHSQYSCVSSPSRLSVRDILAEAMACRLWIDRRAVGRKHTRSSSQAGCTVLWDTQRATAPPVHRTRVQPTVIATAE